MVAVQSRPLPPGIAAEWAVARRTFEAATRGMQCRHLLHVHHPNCLEASLDMGLGSFLGAAKFFVPFYVAHILWNGKKAIAGDKDFYTQTAYYYARSALFGSAMGLFFSASSCCIVRLMGGFSFWTSMLVPGSIAGLSILIEHVYRRRIVMNTFYNMTLQYLYVRAQVGGVVRRTTAGETAFFMLANALLLYLLHKASTSKKKATVFWFFIPRDEREEIQSSFRETCPVLHNEPCWKSALQATARYSALAACLQLLRILMSRGSKVFQRPLIFIEDFASRRTVAGITSMGGYVLLYKAVRCALAKFCDTDRCEHSAAAGLIAGMAYWLQPNTTILTSALIAIIRLLHDYLPKRLKVIGQWPMPELLFALCNGILFHARCMDMAHCPKFIINMMDIATQNRSKTIYYTYLQAVSKLQTRI